MEGNLNTEEFQNIDQAINLIVSDRNFEHLGDIVFIIRKLGPDDMSPDIIKARVFAIVKKLWLLNAFKISGCAGSKIQFSTTEQIIVYLESNWDGNDPIGNNYILFFERND